jgi:hypothetical protein
MSMAHTKRYRDLILKVKDYNSFLTVDELNAQLENFSTKKIIEMVKIGESDAGEPIHCAVMGKGKKSVLFFGFPHPNEPFGSLSCIELIKLVAGDKELSNKFTWYIIPCSDPDGARLNEGWFKGKFTIRKYVYNYYRSGPGKSTEWSFPTNYKGFRFSNQPKSVTALAALIRKVKPEFVYPAYDSGLSGGAYFFITDPMPEKYYDEIFELCKSLSIPLHMGEKEMEFIEVFRKPVYKSFGFSDYYKYYKSKDRSILSTIGEASEMYAKRMNPKAFCLLAEVPYAYDPRIMNTSISAESKHDILKEALPLQYGFMHLLDEVYKSKCVNKNSVFYPSFKHYYNLRKIGFKLYKKKLKVLRGGSCTVAEEFSEKMDNVVKATARLGMVSRLLSDSGQSPEITRFKKSMSTEIESRLAYLDKCSDYTFFPIKTLIQLQLGLLLLTLEYDGVKNSD